MTDFHPSRKELDVVNGIFQLSQNAVDKLVIYYRLLVQWQAKTNLVAPSTLGQFWQRHVADSLQLYSLYPDARQWTDLGSGAGFPGMVLAILLSEAEEGSVRLVESVQKKSAFLRKVANETGASATIYSIRIESAAKQMDEAQIITARALASLDKLLSLTEGHIGGERFAVFHKGREFKREIEQCRGKWSFDLVVVPSKIDPESVLLEVRNARLI